MSAPFLLASICAAVLGQVVVVVLWALWRRRAVPYDGIAEVGTSAPPMGPPAAWAGWRPFRIAARRFEDDSQTQCSLVLEPVDELALAPFLPGQFLTFSLPNNGSEPALLRCYSISDRPQIDNYRITVKRALAVSDTSAPPVRPFDNLQ